MDSKEIDYMNELDAALSMRPAYPAILLLFIIAGFVSFCILWAAFSEVEELTRGQGQVVLSLIHI